MLFEVFFIICFLEVLRIYPLVMFLWGGGMAVPRIIASDICCICLQLSTLFDPCVSVCLGSWVTRC